MLIIRTNFRISAANYSAVLMSPEDVCHKIEANLKKEVKPSQLGRVLEWCSNAKPQESLDLGTVTITAIEKKIII